MSDWLALSLACALSLASADTATKRFLVGYSAAQLVMVRFGLTALLLLPLLFLFPPPWPRPAFWGWMGVALPLEVLAEVLYVIAIRDSPLALTLPYLAFTPVFTTATGYFLLGEEADAQGLVGILLVVAGAYALNLDQASRARPATWLAPLKAIVNERGSRYMLAVALIYGLTSVLGKGAMGDMPPASFGALYFFLVGLFTLAVFSVREPAAIRILARPRAAHWLVAALMAVMVVSHFLALAQVETAYMIAVKRLSILFAILMGAWYLAERHLARHLVAGSMMVGGVALIAL